MRFARESRSDAFLVALELQLIMRLVVQKVAQASVTSTVSGQPTVTSSINRGLMVLVGFEKGDTEIDIQAMRKYLLKLRLYPSTDDPPKQNILNIADAGVDLLLVSQFTLSATLKSGRPSFHRAMEAGDASQLFMQFVTDCRDNLPEACQVGSGVFGSWMQVHLVNEGPVTICLTCKDGKCDTW